MLYLLYWTTPDTTLIGLMPQTQQREVYCARYLPNTLPWNQSIPVQERGKKQGGQRENHTAIQVHGHTAKPMGGAMEPEHPSKLSQVESESSRIEC